MLYVDVATGLMFVLCFTWLTWLNASATKTKSPRAGSPGSGQCSSRRSGLQQILQLLWLISPCHCNPVLCCPSAFSSVCLLFADCCGAAICVVVYSGIYRCLYESHDQSMSISVSANALDSVQIDTQILLYVVDIASLIPPGYATNSSHNRHFEDP